MRTIIVDDELQSRQLLQRRLSENHPEINVLGNGDGVEKGIELINKWKPELVFLDIEMPDGTGFDLLRKLNEKNFHVIFITAFNEHAITAIRCGALDYLLKPVDPDDLASALQRVKKKRTEIISNEGLKEIKEALEQLKGNKLPSSIMISTSEGIHRIIVEKIIRLEAHQNYTEFMIDGRAKTLLASLNIGEYNDHFELYPYFMKVHRSHIVNLNFVDKYVRADGGYLVMQNGDHVNVSRALRDDLLDRLSKI